MLMLRRRQQQYWRIWLNLCFKALLKETKQVVLLFRRNLQLMKIPPERRAYKLRYSDRIYFSKIIIMHQPNQFSFLAMIKCKLRLSSAEWRPPNTSFNWRIICGRQDYRFDFIKQLAVLFALRARGLPCRVSSKTRPRFFTRFTIRENQ